LLRHDGSPGFDFGLSTITQVDAERIAVGDTVPAAEVGSGEPHQSTTA